MTNPIQRAIESQRAETELQATMRTAFEAKRAREAADAALGYGTRKITSLAELELVRELMSEALAYRLGGPEPEAPAAERFAGMSFADQVSTLLSLRGESRLGRMALISRGITTGDLPELLVGAGNRILRKAFDAYRDGLITVAARVPSRDFRDVKLIQVDGDLTLEEVPDGGAFTDGTVQASAESYSIATYGRLLQLSHALFTDDDLGAFASLAERLGRAAAEFVGGKLAALLEANGAMSDGVALFAAGHGNLAAAGPLTETSLGAMAQLMRSQRGPAGERISVAPHALVVPPAIEFAARKLVGEMGNPAPLRVVVEPRLTSTAAYYLVADPEAGMGLAVTFLSGSEAPTIELRKRPGFVGLQGKVKLDFGCGLADYRGLVKNAG